MKWIPFLRYMKRNELSNRIIALGDEVQKEYPDAAGLLYTVATTVITEQDSVFLQKIDSQVKDLLLVTKLAKAMKEGTLEHHKKWPWNRSPSSEKN